MFAEPLSLLGRPTQLSVLGILWLYLDLSSLSTVNRIGLPEHILSKTALSWRPVRPDTRTVICFQRLGGPNVEGTLLAAVLLLMDAPECGQPSGLVVEITVASSRHCVHVVRGCDIVQSDHAPQAGVAQGIFDGELVRRRVGHQVELEEEQDKDVGRRVSRDAQRTTHRCACMHDIE